MKFEEKETLKALLEKSRSKLKAAKDLLDQESYEDKRKVALFILDRIRYLQERADQTGK